MATASSSWVPAPLPLPAMGWGSLQELGGIAAWAGPFGTPPDPWGSPTPSCLGGSVPRLPSACPWCNGDTGVTYSSGDALGASLQAMLGKDAARKGSKGDVAGSATVTSVSSTLQSTERHWLVPGGSGALVAAPARAVGGSTALAGSSPGNNPPTPPEAPVHLRQPPCWHGTARRALPGDDKSRRD